MNTQLRRILDLTILDIVFLMGILIMALILQFWLHELPCPLCLLQRVGFMGISIGFLLNLRFGIRASHYAISLLASIYTAFVALRQITLHVVPGSGGYGELLFGYHLYTWVFIIAVGMIVFITLLLLVDDQFKGKGGPAKFQQSKQFRQITNAIFLVVVIVMSINLVTTFSECGLKQCPDNPTRYRYLEDIFSE